ncbi:unnamed protein product, partial [Thlaspi arvense]
MTFLDADQICIFPTPARRIAPLQGLECYYSLLLLAMIEIFSIVHLVQPQNQDGFISLACGMPNDESPYTDPDTLIQTGKSGRVDRAFDKVDIKPYLTLRYFPEGRRNCYVLNVTSDITYLIAANFLYGNYDGLDAYPIFDLHLGPNMWGTVVSNDTTSRLEIIHIPRSSSLEICLEIQCHISTIEIRPLPNDTYGPRPSSLATSFRRFFNASTDYSI